MINEYTGEITKILFKKDDFLIGIIHTETEEIKFKGNLYGVDKGDQLTIKGEWAQHTKYGDQLVVNEWKRPIPSTKNQVITFLSSGMIKGCGYKRAIDIANHLGENAISIINRDGEKALDGIKGIGKKTAKAIAESIKATFEIQEIMAQLLSYGVTANLTLKLYKKYDSETVQVVQQNPYILTEMDSIGFLKADEIAKQMGILPTSGYRINACVKFVLNQICFQKGHCYVEEDELIKETLLALNHHSKEHELVQMNELEQSIYTLEDHYLVIEHGKVYPKHFYKYEDKLARKLSQMKGLRDGEALPFLDKHIREYQKHNKIILADKQREAIRTLFEEQLLILTGGPGTGKTTITKAMLDIYKKVNPNHKICLCAPTGRASRKLYEVTSHEASTTHRLIGYKQGEIPEYNESNTLDCDLLIVDEFSMVDLQLAYWLFNALSRKTKVLLIGDIDQLPSVGSGNVLSDLIKSGILTIQLTEVFRQAQESQIIQNAHRINQGKNIVIDESKKDFFFIKRETPNDIANLIVLSAMRFIELGYSLEDILVLSPMKKGDVGTFILNEKLRDHLNPANENRKEWKIGKRLFREGDKVIQNVNNHNKNVFNGDMGIIQKIMTQKDDEGNEIDIMLVDYPGQTITYVKEELKELDLAYAISIHKSQGGEAKIVIIPATTSHYIMLARNLFYTGVTRAKEKLVLIGTEKAMNIAVNNNQISKRNSQLEKRIMAYGSHMKRFDQTVAKHS